MPRQYIDPIADKANNAVVRSGDTMTGRLTTASTTGTMAASSAANSIDVRGASGAGNAAYMTFQRPGAYAVNLGLNTDNRLKVGGFSMGTEAHEIFHFGNAAHALAYSGMQINGSMEVSQELGIDGGVSVAGYVCDGWGYAKAGTSVGNAVATSTAWFPPLQNSLVLDTTTASPWLAAGDFSFFQQSIEGYRVARLGWGAASAMPITIAFWTAHHQPGLYTGAIRNAAVNRSYAFSYTHASADTSQYNVVTIPGDTSGTWNKTNSAGLILSFAQASGTTFIAPSLNTRVAGNYIAGPGQVNAVAAADDYFRIGGVVVLPGLYAPTAAQSPLIMRPYDQELVTCQRYYRHWGRGQTAVAVTLNNIFCGVDYLGMRATPSASLVTTSIMFRDPLQGMFTSTGSALDGPTIAIDGGFLEVTGFTGLTSGNVGATYTGFLKLDARL